MDRVESREKVQPLQSPICREIRSKKVFNLKSIPIAPGDVLDQSNWCWCRVTQQVFGPDGDKVRPEKCVNGRECYKSSFG
jgi:hypothetical protein